MYVYVFTGTELIFFCCFFYNPYVYNNCSAVHKSTETLRDGTSAAREESEQRNRKVKLASLCLFVYEEMRGNDV